MLIKSSVFKLAKLCPKQDHRFSGLYVGNGVYEVCDGYTLIRVKAEENIGEGFIVPKEVALLTKDDSDVSSTNITAENTSRVYQCKNPGPYSWPLESGKILPTTPPRAAIGLQLKHIEQLVTLLKPLMNGTKSVKLEIHDNMIRVLPDSHDAEPFEAVLMECKLTKLGDQHEN